MSGGSDTQSAPASDPEPQSKWEAFKEKVGDTVSSMRENAREEVGVFACLSGIYLTLFNDSE